jgi:hypothetical protein
MKLSSVARPCEGVFPRFVARSAGCYTLVRCPSPTFAYTVSPRSTSPAARTW